MFRNYLKTAYRSLLKHKVFSLVNIVGLSIGLTVCCMLALYVGDELSYDRYNDKADRIFRVVHSVDWGTGLFKLAPTSAPFAPALKAEFPEIEQAVRIVPEGGDFIGFGDKQVQTRDIFLADASIFQVFNYPFLKGNPATALTAPQSVVLTKSLAEKLFKNAEDAMGKTVNIDRQQPAIVTGVMADVPDNSHLRFSALRSLPEGWTDGWQNFSIYTYVLLKKGVQEVTLEPQLRRFYEKYLHQQMGKAQYHLWLQPLTSIHLHSNLEYELSPNGDIKYVYIFIATGTLILLIAMINYMTLSTARSSKRVKEVGVRKVIGSGRWQLALLFLAESVVLALIAAFLSALLVESLLPYFNGLSGKNLSLFRFGMGNTLAGLLVFALVAGLVSGIYPAVFLSGFQVMTALKGQVNNKLAGVFLRKSLVVFQFVVTIAMIAASWIIYEQLRYVRHTDLGFNKAQVLTFHIHNQQVRNQLAEIKAKLLQNPHVQSVAAAGNPIGNNDIGGHSYRYEKDGVIEKIPHIAKALFVDEDFLSTLQIRLAEGRNFNTAMPTDKLGAVLVNETLVKNAGWDDPIGKKVQYVIDDSGTTRESVVVGVAKDFHIYSLQHRIEPMVMHLPPVPKEQDNLYARVSLKDLPATLEFITLTYKQFDKANPAEFHFLDENFSKQYAAEQKEGNLLLTFTVLAITIACLGLFGLSAFVAEQRTKEIGVRKVLGATDRQIIAHLSGSFVRLVGIAFVLATPLAWIGMRQWLNGFAYRIPIHWWVFVLAGVLAVFIALVTVSWQAIRAAKGDPVKALKYE